MMRRLQIALVDAGQALAQAGLERGFRIGLAAGLVQPFLHQLKTPYRIPFLEGLGDGWEDIVEHRARIHLHRCLAEGGKLRLPKAGYRPCGLSKALRRLPFRESELS